eukprot:TRINITY_DN4617_c0_g1_i1.p1 TRINITY_DN4617_c0_g1~~TRINITY_DN4617_c0_g1_i1.p1  ORF type:complete len:760 (+),score=271.86 TRINITY_DN4617_c0_g1_i1:137-2416(+)
MPWTPTMRSVDASSSGHASSSKTGGGGGDADSLQSWRRSEPKTGHPPAAKKTKQQRRYAPSGSSDEGVSSRPVATAQAAAAAAEGLPLPQAAAPPVGDQRRRRELLPAAEELDQGSDPATACATAGEAVDGGGAQGKGAIMPRRRAWADMASDDEESSGSGSDAVPLFRDWARMGCMQEAEGQAPQASASATSCGGSGPCDTSSSTASASPSGGAAPAAESLLAAGLPEQAGGLSFQQVVGPGDGVEHPLKLWSQQVQELSAKMRFLATWVPEMPPGSGSGSSSSSTAPAGTAGGSAAASKRSKAVADASSETDLSGAQLAKWQAAAQRLADARGQVARLRAQVESDKAAVLAAEQEAAAASAAKVEQALQQAKLKRARVEEQAKAAEDAAAQAEAAAARRAKARAEALQALKKRLAEEVKAAEAAERKAKAAVAEAAAADADAKELPTLLEKRKKSEAEGMALEKACAQLSKQLEPLRAELGAADKSSKIEALKAKCVKLEGDVKDLQQQLSSTDKGASTAGAPASNKTILEAAELEAELALAKEANLKLVTEARSARIERDKQDARLKALKTQVASCREKQATSSMELRDLRQQVAWLEESMVSAKAEAELRRSELKELEKEQAEAEKAAVRTREKHQDVDAKTRGLLLAKRRAEENEAVLTWKLKQAVDKLAKERKGDPFIKGLQAGRLTAKGRSAAGPVAGGGTGASTPTLQQGMPQRHLGMSRSRGCPSTGEESANDAEVSTNAGEDSVAEVVA